MGQSTDQIRREIDQSRNDAATKIDQLQSQVQNTAQDLRTNVQGATEDVIGQVKDTVDETIESVKQNLDFREQIEQRPLLSLGVALVGGFLLGGRTGGNGQQSHQYHPAPYPQGDYSSGGAQQVGYRSSSSAQSGALAQGLRSAVQKTGLEDTISDAAAALLGSLTDQLKSTVDKSFPGFADKMSTAQESSGTFASKAKDAQSPTTDL